MKQLYRNEESTSKLVQNLNIFHYFQMKKIKESNFRPKLRTANPETFSFSINGILP